MMKKGLHTPTPGCKCYWFLRVCRPQIIMVCLGKRCKANCTFSAEKYTWFTVWKLPPPQPFHVITYNNQNKEIIKDQSSSPPQTSGSFKSPLHSLSVHYQSIFIDTGMSLFLQFIVALMHTVRSKCDKGNGANRGPLSPVMRYQAGKARIPEMTSTTRRLTPICCVCSVHRGKVSCDCLSSVCTPVSEGSSHLHTVRVPLLCAIAKSLFRGSLRQPSFFLFCVFCSYVSIAPLLRTGFPQR